MLSKRGEIKVDTKIEDINFNVTVVLTFLLKSLCFDLIDQLAIQNLNTVELGYNDHGYNEFTAITNSICKNSGSQMFNLVHKASRL